jgi:hypothetical protein
MSALTLRNARLAATTAADHDILDVIKILADISGKKACTA